MPRVAVVGALAVEAEVVRRRHEEGPQDVALGHVIDLRRHIQNSPYDWHCATES